MILDDLILLLQRGVDRLTRRLRLGPQQATSRRRLLIIQIDGLSRSVLEQGLATRSMPFLAALLRRGLYRVDPMSVGMPTCTPAFQLAAMYGVKPDIPGFHYHDKRRGEDVHFPRAGHAALVEESQAAGRVGILTDGSAYGSVFTGGAKNDTLSFSRLKSPTGDGLLRLSSAFVVLAGVVAKGLARTVVEGVRSVPRLVARPSTIHTEWRWLGIKVGISIWIRELFTLAVSRDLYAGVPAILVNYLDYDVAAHAFGPRSARALRSLRQVDRSLRALHRVLRRVPEHQYDVYILSDHGQTPSTDYQTVTKGAPLERRLLDDVLGPSEGLRVASSPREAFAHGFLAYHIGHRAVSRRFFARLEPRAAEREEREVYERDGLRAISAGPNAFLYFTDTAQPVVLAEIERRFPGLGEEISRSPGIGFVLARGPSGPVCFWRGKRYELGKNEAGPFADRSDRDIVMRGLSDLMSMPSAGDLVIYGTDAPEGQVSYIPERGAHAGPSPDELHTFIVHTGRTPLPAPLTHPAQLYDLFIRYRPGGPLGSSVM